MRGGQTGRSGSGLGLLGLTEVDVGLCDEPRLIIRIEGESIGHQLFDCHRHSFHIYCLNAAQDTRTHTHTRLVDVFEKSQTFDVTVKTALTLEEKTARWRGVPPSLHSQCHPKKVSRVQPFFYLPSFCHHVMLFTTQLCDTNSVKARTYPHYAVEPHKQRDEGCEHQRLLREEDGRC